MKKLISVVLAVVIACSMMSLTTFADSLKGDVNGDNNVSAVDARIILQYVAELITPENTDSYDVNGDGNITAVDARIVLQIVAGLVEYPDADESPFDSQEEQLAYFIASFNGVKENASSATHEYSKMYNYNNYVYIHPVVKALYEETAEPGAPTMEEEITAELDDELKVVDKTYTGEEIDESFPPRGGTCNLKMSDISNISIKDDGEYYLVEMTVKGKKNPARYESVGNVATIVTKEDLEADISPEDLEKMSVDCDYKEAVVKAKIEKSTGNMVEYSVDYGMIVIMGMKGLGTITEVGMGFYEEWTIAY